MTRTWHSVEGATPYAWPIEGAWNIQNTAVIVIDMQRDFIDPSGYFSALGESNTHLLSAVEPCRTFLQFAREKGFFILHTRESHRPELVDLNTNKRIKAERNGAAIGSQGPLGRLLVRGQFGCDFFTGFEPAAGEIVVDKPGNSAFYATDLEHILRVKGIRHLLLMGVTTDVCVSSTMRDGNDRGYDCLLIDDCCGAANEQLHNAMLESIGREGGIFGAHIGSQKLIDFLSST
ncbi:TPA: cysteine hydrolase [Klebsiella variicola]|uniref:cysteine hydrolase family protein n=1 Tax=Klebsiella pneumoniae TaxID=573 RepID=UPI0015EAAE75|nr:isochorismatase family cysteine hydrolase [Klebsiella pneumoniae]EIY5386368.1 cysteine hydrolase [Klebsiella variicola]MDU4248891.1 isochorismatase family cysteine hydrolase [Thomasclavelia ramosa]QLR70943.1 cysteine hydrolase [Klebsiella pneumoniae]QLR70968.1 cysteine hydrolase [Klebsiella pneumoniae]HBX9977309.1 cysteine hydrolase [Klebsiella variicola]